MLDRRQVPLLLENPEPLSQHGLGIHELVKPRLTKLDSRNQRWVSAAFVAIAKAGIGILKGKSYEVMERGRTELIFRSDALPVLRALWHFARQGERRIAAGLHAQGIGDSGPYASPQEHIAIRDVERLVVRGRSIARPRDRLS